MHARLTTLRLAMLPATAVALVIAAAPAYASPATDFEMPFPCGQTWTGTTRSGHSPSYYAVDWNRVDDVDDPVVASAAGTVIVADTVADTGYGRWVEIDHGNGEKSLYAHMNTVTVTVGEYVDQGEQVGTLGSTGNSTGPHLHFEERDGSTVIPAFFHQLRFVYNSTLKSHNCVDVPLAPDWNRDGIAEPTVFHRGNPATFVTERAGQDPLVRTFGTSIDDPVIGDWDGNGSTNVGIRTSSSRTFLLRLHDGIASIVFGEVSDRPVAGDWDGDGRWEIGVWRPSRARFIERAVDGTRTSVRLGDADDLPVTGDWDADGITDVGVFDQATATFTLRRVDSEGMVWLATVPFGKPGDLPVVGDWDGNGRDDLGVWTPSTAVFTKRIADSPTTTLRRTESTKLGHPRG